MPFQIELEDPRIGFASAHFIVDHKKCGKIHGHNYFLKVTLTGELDEHHMILDYALLKAELRKLTKKLDHKVLLAARAKNLEIDEMEEAVIIRAKNKRYVIPQVDVILLPIPATTAEELAKYFHKKLKALWPDFQITTEIEESPGARAIYRGP